MSKKNSAAKRSCPAPMSKARNSIWDDIGLNVSTNRPANQLLTGCSGNDYTSKATRGVGQAHPARDARNKIAKLPNLKPVVIREAHHTRAITTTKSQIKSRNHMKMLFTFWAILAFAVAAASARTVQIVNQTDYNLSFTVTSDASNVTQFSQSGSVRERILIHRSS
jgi:hypothetical protein